MTTQVTTPIHELDPHSLHMQTAFQEVVNIWFEIENSSRPLDLHHIGDRIVPLGAAHDGAEECVIRAAGLILLYETSTIPLPSWLQLRRGRVLDCSKFTSYGDLATAMMNIIGGLELKRQAWLQGLPARKGPRL